ncbi:MAG TPA: hypothetical protein VFM34_04795 [Moraxellaceae bacterium]|nr:hypothetical protein [Moraxellaceae bacterium]
MRTTLRASFPSLLPALGFFALLALAIYAFSAGIGGRFIFDDEPNLQPWRTIGDIHSYRDVLAFITSGIYFPGRPLSLLSFLIDDQSWPADIAALKRTNLALHLLNACLVMWLSLTVLAKLLPARPAIPRAWLALFITAIWTLHPLQVSNVSYVIQRMNLLSTFLTLAGLLLYMRGREHLETRPWRAVLQCGIAIGLFMPLAVLAKENGLLLCAFVLLVEGFCFPQSKWRLWSALKAVGLWGPLLALVAYTLYTYRGFTVPWPNRDFNAWERLLTQGPVLADYLDKLLIPRLHGAGLYYDNFPVSRSLLSPTTLFAWLGLTALLFLAWRLRRQNPLFSFGIFFYFTGHLMESTVLPLELYFEHRNYLPQLGLWMALGAVVDRAHRPRLRHVLAAGAVILTLMLAWMSRHNAVLWSNPDLQAATWYHDNPGSQRTTLYFANSLVKQRRFTESAEVLDRGRRDLPDSLIVALAQKYVECYLLDQPTNFDDLVPLARTARYETSNVEMLETLWKLADDPHRPATTLPGHCRSATIDDLAAVYTAMLENPRFQSGRIAAILNANLGAWSARRGRLDAAIDHYDRAFAADPNPLYPFEQAMLLQSAGLPVPAREYVQKGLKSLTLRMRLLYPAMEANLTNLDRALQELSARHG